MQAKISQQKCPQKQRFRHVLFFGKKASEAISQIILESAHHRAGTTAQQSHLCTNRSGQVGYRDEPPRYMYLERYICRCCFAQVV